MIPGLKSRPVAPTEELAIQFCQQHLKPCPACGSSGDYDKEARWTFVDTYYYYKCNCCGTVYKVGKSDLNGFAYSVDSLAGMVKFAKKKKATEIYVTVESLGPGAKNPQLKAGESYTIEDLKDKASMFTSI